LADFLQAAESFPRPGRTEQKARMHPVLVAQNASRAKIFHGWVFHIFKLGH
jgi:hypothetical protein